MECPHARHLDEAHAVLVLVLLSSAPLFVVMSLLVVSIVIIGACYCYRKKRVQWELVDSRGYDERDREAYELERVDDL
jgi:hypothetical protein